jgi:hypothetical protein
MRLNLLIGDSPSVCGFTRFGRNEANSAWSAILPLRSRFPELDAESLATPDPFYRAQRYAAQARYLDLGVTRRETPTLPPQSRAQMVQTYFRFLSFAPRTSFASCCRRFWPRKYASLTSETRRATSTISACSPPDPSTVPSSVGLSHGSYGRPATLSIPNA